MRVLKKLLLWLIGLVAVLIALSYATGNGHLPRGVWFTYLRGRTSPEIDDRDFFSSATIPADAPPAMAPRGTLWQACPDPG